MSRGLPWASGVLVIVCACWTGQSDVVREKAAAYLPCSREGIAVTKLVADPKKDHSTLSGKAVYRVDGCGQHLFYICEGWDSYEQKSLCEPSATSE